MYFRICKILYPQYYVVILTLLVLVWITGLTYDIQIYDNDNVDSEDYYFDNRDVNYDDNII